MRITLKFGRFNGAISFAKNEDVHWLFSNSSFYTMEGRLGKAFCQTKKKGGLTFVVLDLI